MKKVICFILCMALLSACAGNTAPDKQPDADATAETSVTIEEVPPESAEETEAPKIVSEAVSAPPPAEPPYSPKFSLVIDDAMEAKKIAAVRTDITARFDGLVSGENNTDKFLNIAPINGVRLNSWDVKNEGFAKPRADLFDCYTVTLTLDVAESDNDFIPVGVNDYLLIYAQDVDKQYLPLRIVGTYDFEKELPNFVDPVADHVTFCNNFTRIFADCFKGDDITDFSSPDALCNNYYVYLALHAAMTYYPGLTREHGLLKYDDLDKAFRSLYGFSADALGLRESEYYNEETDSIWVPDGGGSWYVGSLEEDVYNEADCTHTVTIEYFEDDLFLARAQTCRYTVRENEDGTYTMLRLERLFNSDRKILYGEV